MNLQTDRRFRRSDLGLVTTFVVTLGIFFALLVPLTMRSSWPSLPRTKP